MLRLKSFTTMLAQMDFYGTANKAIVEPIDIFNTLSSMPSSVKGLIRWNGVSSLLMVKDLLFTVN